ncbi:hypothetical protein M0R45_035997 [Rubus argutus]|uniref:Phytocyanin domain-containing protein n=1 Tax=Rubus argutus TaxID=59490 RepID=A0AAW1VXL2_RUBAR
MHAEPLASFNSPKIQETKRPVLLNWLAVFNFEGGLSNVVQVTKQDYERCTAYKPLKIFNNDQANFTLLEKGVFYFISNVSNYCSLGRRFPFLFTSAPAPLINHQGLQHRPLPFYRPLPAAVRPPSSVRSQLPVAAALSPIGYNGSSPVKSAASILLLHEGMMHGVFYGIIFGWVAFLFRSSIYFN